MKNNLIGHWKMDEENGKSVFDDSGNEMHGVATNNLVATPGKFSRARYFNRSGYISIPHHPIMQLRKKDFTFSGWIKIKDYAYPLTTFAVIQGYGCYFSPGRKGFTSGWDIGHGFAKGGTKVCIRDHLSNKVYGKNTHDSDYTNDKLIEKWTHYTIVFNRKIGKIFLYLNGKKQKSFLDITKVTGDVINNKPLIFGLVHGWKTKDFIDEYRMYNKALTDLEVKIIYNDHNV